MQNKCKILIKAGIVAVIASLSIVVPTQAGDMTFGSKFTTDRYIANVLQRDDHTVTTVLNDSFVVFTGAEFVAASSGANTEFFLGGAGSSLDYFSSPDVAVNAINSMTTGFIDFRDVVLLDVIAASEILPNLSQKPEDPPLLMKWIYSLLDAVGKDEQCSDPTDGRATKCDNRFAAQQ